MKPASLFGHCAELLRIIIKNHQAPDIITKQFLRSKKYLGSKERKFISTIVYYILRIKSIPEYCITHPDTRNLSLENINANTNKDKNKTSLNDFLLVLAGVLALERLNIYPFSDLHFDPRETSTLLLLEKFGIPENDSSGLINQIQNTLNKLIINTDKIIFNNRATKKEIKLAAIRYATQDWILETLINTQKYDSDMLKDLFVSFYQPAPLTLRINSHHSTRDEILSRCREFDPEADETQYSPFGIRLSKRFDFNTIAIYKQGLVEVQDEGSQLISLALDAEEDDMILDACAGAGGKTLHLASLTHDNSTIFASDIELRKLKELNKRSRRAGFKSITTYLPKNMDKSLHGKFDKVLIDAPCSGMGTVRRNPMLKWRLTPKLLEKYNKKQYKILEEYSSYVSSGGVLLYATCSILPQENEMIIEKFLNNHPEFSPYPLKPAFEKFNIELPGLGDDDFQYQLLPSVHGCDGFFFSKLIHK
jgi:16S rRNA (cytosine967-C5)-methyltransferase